jgi:hypothetical protein
MIGPHIASSSHIVGALVCVADANTLFTNKVLATDRHSFLAIGPVAPNV